jgi:class 3 adenylate cyclase
MFTDIVDSTKLAEALGEAQWEKLLAWHDRTLKELLQAEGGEVIKQTGDGFFAAFESPAAAVEAAVAVQRALDSYEGVAPDVRIGLHAGGAFTKDEGDYGGQGVHAAARIGALAGAGEIIASAETLDGVALRYQVKDARTVELKGISEPVEVASIAWR